MNAHCPTADAQQRARRAQPWLGTLVDIAAHADSERVLAEGVNAAFVAIARVHRGLGSHDAESELTRVNRRAALAKQTISTDLREVLSCALAFAACSEGAFDPTVGTELVALGLLPPLVRHARGATWRDVVLDEAGVLFKRPLVLDFGGIAKGYAVDCAIAALRDAGFSDPRWKPCTSVPAARRACCFRCSRFAMEPPRAAHTAGSDAASAAAWSRR